MSHCGAPYKILPTIKIFNIDSTKLCSSAQAGV